MEILIIGRELEKVKKFHMMQKKLTVMRNEKKMHYLDPMHSHSLTDHSITHWVKYSEGEYHFQVKRVKKSVMQKKLTGDAKKVDSDAKWKKNILDNELFGTFFTHIHSLSTQLLTEYVEWERSALVREKSEKKEWCKKSWHVMQNEFSYQTQRGKNSRDTE